MLLLEILILRTYHMLKVFILSIIMLHRILTQDIDSLLPDDSSYN